MWHCSCFICTLQSWVKKYFDILMFGEVCQLPPKNNVNHFSGCFVLVIFFYPRCAITWCSDHWMNGDDLRKSNPLKIANRYETVVILPSVQFSSVIQSCPTLCDPMNRSTPGLPVHHQLLEFTQTHAHWVGDAIQPPHPLSPPSPPAPTLLVLKWFCLV